MTATLLIMALHKSGCNSCTPYSFNTSLINAGIAKGDLLFLENLFEKLKIKSK